MHQKYDTAKITVYFNLAYLFQSLRASMEGGACLFTQNGCKGQQIHFCHLSTHHHIFSLSYKMILLYVQGIMKPDIVFFGEDLPRKFYSYMKDMLQTDLVLVMGTSLEVI